MAHSAGRYQQDLGFVDGVMILGPDDAFASGGASVLTRNAAGDISHTAGAAVAPIYDFNLGKAQFFRTGYPIDLQEQFGTAAGVAGPTAVANTGGPDGGVTGRPPFTGATQITPVAGNRLKGIKFLSLKVIYQILGAALTGHTIRMDKTVYANNVALAISAILAVGANGLATAIQANPYVTAIALAAGQQVYRVSDLSQYTIELAPTTQAAGSFKLYGIEVLCEFNFN